MTGVGSGPSTEGIQLQTDAGAWSTSRRSTRLLSPPCRLHPVTVTYYGAHRERVYPQEPVPRDPAAGTAGERGLGRGRDGLSFTTRTSVYRMLPRTGEPCWAESRERLAFRRGRGAILAEVARRGACRRSPSE